MKRQIKPTIALVLYLTSALPAAQAAPGASSAGPNDFDRFNYDNAIRYALNTANGNVVEAKAYFGKGDYARAAARFAQARQRSSRDPYVLNASAWFKATCPDGSFRNGKEAVQESTKACELSKWKDCHEIDTLAAAWAEAGDFTQTIKYQMQALATRPPPASDSLKQMQKHLRSYQAHKTFRQEPRLRKARN